MANENRIIEVKLTLKPGPPFEGDSWVVEVTKEFAPEYGGGTQVFSEYGGRSTHRALDVARGMVTLSPGSRTDLGPRDGVADFDPNPATNRRQA